MDRFKLLTRIIIAALLFAVPMFFTTTLSEYFELPKTLLVYAAFFITLILLGVKFFLEKKITLVRSAFDLPLLLLLVSLAFSTYFGANRIQSLINGLAPLAVGILFFFVTTHLLHDYLEEVGYTLIIRVFTGSVTLLALFSFLAYFNVSLFPFDFAKNRFFTPAGSDLTLIILTAMTAPLSLSALLKGNLDFKSPWYYLFAANLTLFGLLIILHTSILGLLAALPTVAMVFLSDREALKFQRPLLSTVGLIFILVAVLFYMPLNFNARFVEFRNSFPRPVTLDGGSSWIISIQAVRDYPFFGSGPATFLADFVRYRPLALNYTPFWAQRFPTPAGEPYLVLATLGLFGLLIFAFLSWRLLRNVIYLLGSAGGKSDGVAFSILAFLIGALFSVPSNSLRVIFFILLGIFTLKALNVGKKEFQALPFLPVILFTALSLGGGYSAFTKLVLAEVSFKRAIDAAVNNDTQGTIQGLNDAVRLNPYRDNYHLSLSSLAYTLANNLAAQPNLSDADRQTLVQLINSAITEAKIAVNLDPFNGSNLETLATIYRNIAGLVENAGNWALVAYQQAMQIEPMNPNLRFQLGSLFFAAGNYEQAANLFADSVRLKNDVPNYHYNLAWALRNRGFIGDAIDAMTVVTRLLPADSEDGKKAATDLADLQALAKKLADEAAKSQNQPASNGQQLEVGSPAESNLSKENQNPVSLPSEASPSGVNRNRR